MKINKAYDNETLKVALVDRDKVIKSLIEEGDFDDNELMRINKYLQLNQFQIFFKKTT